MPPWAALEWERTGCTLERIPTEAPCSAAASAARCPASPAPITSTSVWGKARASLWDDFQRTRSGGYYFRMTTAKEHVRFREALGTERVLGGSETGGAFGMVIHDLPAK